MTRAEFVARFEEQLGGMLLRAWTHTEHGAAAYLELKTHQARLGQLLQQMYAALREQPSVVPMRKDKTS